MKEPTRRRLIAVVMIAALFIATRSTVALAAQSGDFAYEEAGDGTTVIITGYTGSGGSVIVPAEFGGKSVAGIGSRAFYNCAPLTSVTIPGSVAVIGEEAFASCAALTRAIFEGGKPDIAPTAFAEGVPCYYPVSKSADWSAYGGTKQAYCFVTADLKDGNAPARTMADVNDGCIAAPAAPQRTGYAFSGWYREPELATACDFSAGDITSDITVYAKWTAMQYSVTAAANSASYGSVSIAGLSGGKAAYSSAVTVRALPKAGYRFVRWLKGAAAVSTAAEYRFPVSGPCALKAEFAWIAAPGGPKVASASYCSLKLTWQAVAGASGYEVYRAAKSKGAYSLVGTITGPSFTSSSLMTGTTYYYKVRAKCVACGITTYGGYCAVASGKPVPTAPAAVKAASASYSSVKVSWAKVAGATKYEVYRATSKTGSYRKIADTASLTCTSTGLTTGKVYFYKVRAKRSATCGGYSATISAQPVPAAPTGPKAASASGTSIKISWNKVGGATKYEIYRALSGSGAYSKVAETASTSYTNMGLTTGKIYYYKVRAKRTATCGGYSAVSSAQPVPAAPTAVKAVNVPATSLRISWGTVSGVTKYELYRAASSIGIYSFVAETGSTSYTDTGLTTGKFYYYKVRAYRLMGTVKVYGGYSAVTSAAPVQYGQLEDWYKWVYDRFPRKANVKVIDFDTGVIYDVVYVGGHNHADVEPVTKSDTAALKSTFGGKWSWERRAVLVYIGGIWVAGSINGMPHGYESIPGNDMRGQVCIHFLNSRNHVHNAVDPDHQYQVKRAAGQVK